MNKMSLVHHPVYLSFEKKVVCSECLLYYTCKDCIRVCKREILDTSNFVYFQYDCRECLKRIKILLCSVCKNIKCKGKCNKSVCKTI